LVCRYAALVPLHSTRNSHPTETENIDKVGIIPAL